MMKIETNNSTEKIKIDETFCGIYVVIQIIKFERCLSSINKNIFRPAWERALVISYLSDKI